MSHKSKIALIAVTAFSIIAFAVLLLAGLAYKLSNSLILSLIIATISFILYGFGCYRSVIISDKYRFCIIGTLCNQFIVIAMLVHLILTSSAFDPKFRGAAISVFSVLYFTSLTLSAIGGARLARKLPAYKENAKMTARANVLHCPRCGKPQKIFEFTCRGCGRKRFSLKKEEWEHF